MEYLLIKRRTFFLYVILWLTLLFKPMAAQALLLGETLSVGIINCYPGWVLCYTPIYGSFVVDGVSGVSFGPGMRVTANDTQIIFEGKKGFTPPYSNSGEVPIVAYVGNPNRPVISKITSFRTGGGSSFCGFLGGTGSFYNHFRSYAGGVYGDRLIFIAQVIPACPFQFDETVTIELQPLVTESVSLGLSKISPTSLTVGKADDYYLNVVNNGDKTSEATVLVTDQLPANLQFNRAEALSGNLAGVGCTGAGQTQTCKLNIPGGLAPGAQALFSLNVTPLAASAGVSVINRAYVDPTGSNASPPALYPANCTGTDTPVAGCATSQPRTVISQPWLNLSKGNPVKSVVGQPFSYQFMLRNQGGAATGTSLIFYDQLPPNLQYNGAAVVGGGTVNASSLSCTASGTPTSGQSLKCSLTLPGGGLPPQGSTAFTINTSPLLAAGGGALVNRAVIDPSGANAVLDPAQCTDNGQPLPGCAVTPALVPGLDGVSLGLSKLSPPSLQTAQMGSYVLTVRNTGANPSSTTLVFWDQLPPYVQYNSLAPAGGNVLATGASCTSSGTLAAGLLLTCTVQLPYGLPAQIGTTAVQLNITPTQPLAGQTIINRAAIDPQGASTLVPPANCSSDGVPYAGCAVAAPVRVTASAPNLSLSKENPPTLSMGVTSEYRFTLRNAGPGATDTQIVLDDVMYSDISWTATTPLAGGSVMAQSVSCSFVANLSGGLTRRSCVLTLPPGGLPAGGSVKFSASVFPLGPAMRLVDVVNKARVDPTGQSQPVQAADCVSDNNPAGCAVTPSLPVLSGASLIYLAKTNPPQLVAAKAAAYNLLLTNMGLSDTPTSLVVYDQLPPNVAYTSAAVNSLGTIRPTAVSCSVASGTVTLGQLMKCTLTLPTRGIPQYGSAGFTLNVTPNAASSGRMVYNTAATPSDAVTTALDPSSLCAATDEPIGCAIAPPMVVDGGTLKLVVNRTGGGPAPADITFYGSVVQLSFNETLTTPGAGSTVSSDLIPFAGVNLPLAFIYTLPSGAWSVSAASCVDTNASASGNGSQTFNASSLNQGSLVFPGLTMRKSAMLECTISVTGPLPRLALSKSNPGSLAVGMASSYGLSLNNTGTLASGTSLAFSDQLPPNTAFNGVVPGRGGSVTPAGAGCTSSGTLANGLLLNCTVTLPPGGIPAGGSAEVQLSVVPQAGAAGQTLVNKAAIDPTGNNGAVNPGTCTANGSPEGCSVTPGLVVQGSSLMISVVSSTPGNYVFSGNNGWATQTLNVPASSQVAVGSPQALSASVPTTVQFSGPSNNLFISSVACNGMGSGATAGQVSFNRNSFTLDANATARGNAVSCLVRMGLGYRLSLSKVSSGGVGSFTFSGNGGWTSQTLSPSTAGTPVSGATQLLSSAGTALRLNEAAPPGWLLSSVSCRDSNASQSGNPGTALAGRLLDGNSFELGADITRPDAVLQCTVQNTWSPATVQGRVFIDNGVGGGVAHDGVMNGAEKGQGGVSVSLGNCAGTVYASALTDAAGVFSLNTSTAPAGPVCLTQERNPALYDSVSYQGGTAQASYDFSSGALRFNLASGTRYSGLAFGNVPLGVLTGEGSQQVVPGQSAVYAHTYTAGTSAIVSLVTVDTPSQTGQTWRSVVYFDQNCNAQLDSSDTALGPDQALRVAAGQQLCVLVRVFSPDKAQAGSSNRTELLAFASYQPMPAIGTGTGHSLKTDLTTVSTTGAALVLLKQVRKVGSCPSTAADQLAFGLNNQAAPGDFVEYLLTYSNNSAAPLSRILIQDGVPAYTEFRSAVCGSPLPAGLQGCSVTQQPAPGGIGPLQWTLKDAASGPVMGLQPGGQGTVGYCVQVQQ